MNQLIIMTGKSGSGKDSIVRELSSYGYKKAVGCTTRPERVGEDCSDYLFLEERRFPELVDLGYFAEWQMYKTTQGDWYYGTPWKNLFPYERTILILPPERAKKILSIYEEIGIPLPIVIHICANSDSRLKRLALRGDSLDEIERRIRADDEDFAGVETIADRIFFNDDNKVSDVAESIARFLDKEFEEISQGGKFMDNKEIKVYLSGSRDPASTWRKTATEMLKLVAENSGARVVVEDPVVFSSYDDTRSDKMLSMNRLVRSSVVLVNLDGSDSSARTGQECERARSVGIPIVGFGGSGVCPWISSVDCGVVFESMHSAVNYISECFFV